LLNGDEKSTHFPVLVVASTFVGSSQSPSDGLPE